MRVTILLFCFISEKKDLQRHARNLKLFCIDILVHKATQNERLLPSARLLKILGLEIYVTPNSSCCYIL